MDLQKNQLNRIVKYDNSNAIYIVLIVFILLCFLCLFFIKSTVSAVSSGLTRPLNERTEIKPVLSGIIDSLFVKEGDTIKQGQLLATIKDNQTTPQLILNQFELKQRLEFIYDLEKLVNAKEYSSLILETPLYRQQLSRFQFQVSDQEAAIKKATHEQDMYNKLLKDHVIARKEHFDKEIEAERLRAAFEAFKNDQLTSWQNDLQKYKSEVSQLTAQQKQIKTDKRNHYIYAPVSVAIQNINSRYKGNFIAAGESLCIISPESNLIGECYVSTRDIGLLKIGQEARFQIDAFDYNYFGILTGKIISIDNDFSIVENKPVFKVRCTFDSTQLHLKNGYKGELKKGLTFQARFVVAERTLWQLLFDKVDDWLNPTAPIVPQTAKKE